MAYGAALVICSAEHATGRFLPHLAPAAGSLASCLVQVLG